MVFALLMMLAGSNLVTSGDFDQDGRLDRAYVIKEAGGYKLVVARSLGDVVTVATNVPASESFELTKVERSKRKVTCDPIVNSRIMSRYVCDAGDMLRFGNAGGPQTVAIWLNGRFVTYQVQVKQP